MTAMDETLRSTVGRDAEVPRKRRESDMGAKYIVNVPHQFLRLFLCGEGGARETEEGRLHHQHRLDHRTGGREDADRLCGDEGSDPRRAGLRFFGVEHRFELDLGGNTAGAWGRYHR